MCRKICEVTFGRFSKITPKKVVKESLTVLQKESLDILLKNYVRYFWRNLWMNFWRFSVRNLFAKLLEKSMYEFLKTSSHVDFQKKRGNILMNFWRFSRIIKFLEMNFWKNARKNYFAIPRTNFQMHPWKINWKK